MKRILLLSIYLCGFLIAIYAQTNLINLDKIVKKYAHDTVFNGTIIIANSDSIVYNYSFGYSNIQSENLISDSTLFPIASLTKQFTSTGILILQENKMLSINDKISDYLEVPSSMNNVTIQNLMNHTSGIPNYWYHNIANNKDSILNFHFNNDSLLFESNTNQKYCNSGYFFLGLIIEKVSGFSYNDFLKKNIFDKVGMIHTFVFSGEECERAIGYDDDWNTNDYLIETADGGIISCAHDLYLWDKSLFENRIISIESKELMFKETKLVGGKIINYGLGWDIKEDNKNIVSHTGWLASFGAYNQYNIDKGQFIILLSNRIRPELMGLINEINENLY